MSILNTRKTYAASKDDVEKLTSYLKNIPIGFSLNNLYDEVARLFNSQKSGELIKTITSFNELIGKPGTTIEDTAKNLCESYLEMVGGNIDSDKLQLLNNNLIIIFRSYKNLGLSLKARDLLLENENNFHESRIISDLRLVFDEEIENAKRYGIIIHKLHIEYRKERNVNDIYLSLDLADLQQLKDEIERAIKKHEFVKNDYKGSIEFIS